MLFRFFGFKCVSCAGCLFFSLQHLQVVQVVEVFLNTNHTQCKSQNMFSVARRIKIVFRIFYCTAMFSVWLGRGSLELGWKQAYSTDTHDLPSYELNLTNKPRMVGQRVLGSSKADTL